MSSSQKRFGTFSGVFVTNVLTIFGVILFYRQGWVVGNSGLLGSFLILTLANSITFVTALSISSISTNIKVKLGGSYFLISRSLGPEIGGAIGIALFFAQAFSVAFYIIGFTLSIHYFFPFIDVRILNGTVLILITLIAVFSADIAIKIQFGVFVIILISIITFILGNLGMKVQPELMGPFEDGDFWNTFAIFFPAVTGILAGVSLSGDLKDPKKNIPKGTLLSVVFTYLIYMSLVIFFAFNHSTQQLLTDKNIMINSAVIPFVIIIGIWGATLSSALGSILGAPRTLQSLAVDGIVPEFFGKGSGKTNEPRRAMLVTIVFASSLLMVGDVDFVAQILTMIFLTTYGTLNGIVTLESIIKNPAYRPTFKVHWIFSLYGAISCFVVMFLINRIATIAALSFIFIIYIILSTRSYSNNWGDLRKRFWSFLIEVGIFQYESYAEHPRSWRPNIAIFENNKVCRSALLSISSLIAGKSGIISHYLFVDTEIENNSNQTINNELTEIKDYLTEKKYTNIFPEIILTNKDKHAHLITLQADGIASYKSNTIVSDIHLDDNSLYTHFQNLSAYNLLKKSIILIKDGYSTLGEDRIDVWLSGFKSNMALMLLIPHLIKQNSQWKKVRICLRMIVRDAEARKKQESNLLAIVQFARIEADIDILQIDEFQSAHPELEPHHFIKKSRSFFKKLRKGLDKNFQFNMEQKKYSNDDRVKITDIIKTASNDARLVVLGLNIPEKGKEIEYADTMKEMIKELPLTILVKSSHKINLFS
ncbi:MAG: amino acid permease [Spirochaetes bacterium]|nr:amino acid permease [Spirochaetota bacterium]